jgi:hypothetical protein
MRFSLSEISAIEYLTADVLERFITMRQIVPRLAD